MVHQHLVHYEDTDPSHGSRQDGVGGRRGDDFPVPWLGERAVLPNILSQEAEDEYETSEGGKRNRVARDGDDYTTVEPASPGSHQPGTHQGTHSTAQVNNSTASAGLKYLQVLRWLGF